MVPDKSVRYFVSVGYGKGIRIGFRGLRLGELGRSKAAPLQNRAEVRGADEFEWQSLTTRVRSRRLG